MKDEGIPMAQISEYCVRNMIQGLNNNRERLDAIIESLKPVREHYKTDEELAAAYCQWVQLHHIAGHLQGLCNGLEFYLPQDGKDVS